MIYEQIIPEKTKFSCKIGYERTFVPEAMLYRVGTIDWICQNTRSGANDSPNHLGYKYSWRIRKNVFGDGIVEDIKEKKMNHEE